MQTRRLRSAGEVAIWLLGVLLTGLALEYALFATGQPLISHNVATWATECWALALGTGVLMGHLFGQGIKVARWTDTIACLLICLICYVWFDTTLFVFQGGVSIGHMCWQMVRFRANFVPANQLSNR